MTYRFYNPAPVLMDLLGLKPCANGSLTFSELGTTTPKGTWADQAKTIPNANPVPLDSAGRSNTNIWLDGGYTVALRDAAGVVVWTRDVDSGQGAGAAIPALATGQFLTNDGANLLWQGVRQVPDPTGASGQQLGTDGANLIWEPKPTIVIPDLPVANFPSRVKVGTLLIQWGTGSAPASGFRQTSASVTFANAFTSTPHFVSVSVTNTTHTSGGQIAVPAVTAKANTGFAVQFDSNDFGQSNASFVSPVPFDWIAYGPTSA